MVQKYKLLNDTNFMEDVKEELEIFEFSGYVSFKALRIFYNMFSWLYCGEDVEDAFEDSEEANKLRNIISYLHLSAFLGASPAYSAVLMYVKLSLLLDMRMFETGSIVEVKSTSDNKLFVRKDFTFNNLYEIYKNSNFEVPKDFLELNSVFAGAMRKRESYINKYSDVIKAKNIVDIVKPDLPYKLASKSLIVQDGEDEDLVDKHIIVVQDSTQSMLKEEGKLLLIKAFILNEALSNNYTVEWLFASSVVELRMLYDRDSIVNEEVALMFKGNFFDPLRVLAKNVAERSKVILITDGEDDINVKSISDKYDLSIISLSNNMSLKAGLLNANKFFKF